MEQEAARVIVVRSDRLLLMRRNKYGRHYYTLVGGHIEPGETPLTAMLREVDEETGLRLDRPRQVYRQEPVGQYNAQHIFLADYAGGEPGLRADAEERAANRQGANTYEPVWLPLAQLDAIPLFPRELKVQLIHDLRHGFAGRITTITPTGD